MSRGLALTALVLLAAASVYGFRHEHLLQQQLLDPGGQRRFLIYSGIYWAAAGAMLLAFPRWLGVTVAALALIYTAWWSGPAAPIAVLYFFGSCFLAGKILARYKDAATAMLLGLCVAIFAIGIALHFAVNYRFVYIAAMGIPYLCEARRLRGHAGGFHLLCGSRREAAALAALLFVLSIQWLGALMPEVSDDGVSMHLAVPLAVVHDGRWNYDFHQYTWTLMPAGGESVYTAAAVLAGPAGAEAAAKLANFALLAIMAVLIVQASLRFVPPAQAFLVGALFVSTPLTQLVTGSLFVENLWAALILGASLAVLRYHESGEAAELYAGGALLGTALAVKLIAAVFLLPVALIAAWYAIRRGRILSLVPAGLLLAVAAAPPYLYAFLKSGNPVFPFLNTIFHSPYFDSAHPFTDVRFLAPLSFLTPYLVTFRSAIFIEGQGGASGFQYFLLLVPAAILAWAARQKTQLLLLGIAGLSTLALFAFLPNLRYVYPALPLFSIALAVLFGRIPGVSVLFVILTAINCWFLPSSGWYQQEFALFTHSQAADHLQWAAGERLLLDRLNRTAPGEPLAMFDTDMIAGFQGRPYTNSWHTYDYWRRVVEAQSSAEIAAALRERGIHNIMAPASLKSPTVLLDTFLREWAAPEGITSGRMALFHLRDSAYIEPRVILPLPPGEWDDLDDRIEYTGPWIRDRQFTAAWHGSLTYSGGPGDSAHFTFNGSGITYIFTKALNRGMAAVLIDGTRRARIDMYSPNIEWKSQRVFSGLDAGAHSFEVRILKEKNPASSGNFVDVDGILVTP